MKKILILCTGNSCRSIIAEALINSFVDGVEAKSSGINASGIVNPNTKKVLTKYNIWDDKYYSKTLDKVIDEKFDLVVTVCDDAKQNCPIFPKRVPTIHIGFKDPNGLDYEAFEYTYKLIKSKLLIKIKEYL